MEAYRPGRFSAPYVKYKRTSALEVEAYENIFNEEIVAKQSEGAQEASKQLRRFLPKFYGWRELEPEFHTEPDSVNKIIILENLMRGMAKGSIMDIKMGTNTITKNAESKGDPKEIEYSIRKDQEETTSAELGFRITAYMFKNKAGEVYKKSRKQYRSIKKEHVPEIFTEFLKSNEAEKPNLERRDEIVAELKAFLKYQQEVNFYRRITGGSLLFVLDNTVNQCRFKLIDMASVYDTTDKSRDEGFIKGLESLVEIFSNI